MGKQVRFYALPGDEQTFVEFVRQDPDVVILGVPFLKPEPRIIDTLPSIESVDLWWTEVLLWNTKFSFLSDYVQIRNTNLWQPNKSDAPVIEFSRSCIRDEERLQRGRLWVEMYRLENEKLVHKGKVFEQWYDRLARWIRRHYILLKNIDAYIGSEALEWYRDGGRLIR
jgi:hypothetical protein